jgi:hypothetical protein
MLIQQLFYLFLLINLISIVMRLLTSSFRGFSTTNFLQIANFDSDLTALQATVRRFAEEKIAPLAQKVDK